MARARSMLFDRWPTVYDRFPRAEVFAVDCTESFRRVPPIGFAPWLALDEARRR